MLHLIPAPLHRAALRFAHGLRKAWWGLRRPRLRGAVLLVRDAEGAVLLVRHSYEPDLWTLPGGGLRRGEEPAAAARREMREELGRDPAALDFLGVDERLLHGAPCRTHVFAVPAAGPVWPDRREVAEAHFFARNELPRRRAAIVDAALGMSEQR